MRAIVTGSSGFIGAALCENLLRDGWEVLGVDNHTDYYSPTLKEFRKTNLQAYANFRFKMVDIANQRDFDKILIQYHPDTVFHLAAQAGVRIPIQRVHQYTNSNLLGFANVLQSTVSNRVPNFIYASSSSIYGDSASIPYSESELNLNPNSFYGATKLSNELLARALVKDSFTRARGMRFFTVYGPAGRPDMAYFRIIASIISGSKFELYGDGSVERDFTFVDDCTQVIVKLQSELESHEFGFSDVVNVGGGHPVSISALIEMSSAHLGKDLEYKQGKPNNNDVAKTMADPLHLLELIGTKPETPLEVGLARTIDWAINSVNPKELASWVDSST